MLPQHRKELSDANGPPQADHGASLLLNPCDAQLVSDFHEVNALVLGFFIEETRKSIWRYKSATPKSPATNRKWVSSSDVRLALDIQLSDTCWPDGGGLQPPGSLHSSFWISKGKILTLRRRSLCSWPGSTWPKHRDSGVHDLG